jgi:hypothetical protein
MFNVLGPQQQPHPRSLSVFLNATAGSAAPRLDPNFYKAFVEAFKQEEISLRRRGGHRALGTRPGEEIPHQVL